MPTKNALPLAGSERHVMPGAREVGPCKADAPVDATIRLRSRSGQTPAAATNTRSFLSRASFEAQHGADADDIARVEGFAREHGLTVKERSEARRTVILTGPASAMQEAFGVALKEYVHPAGNFRGRTGSIYLPEDLQGVVQGVFGLDNRPQAKPHFEGRELERRRIRSLQCR